MTGPMKKLIDEFRKGWQGISQPSPLFSTGVAVGCLALATMARWGLAQLRPDVFFTPYFPAVFFATAVGGSRIGIATAKPVLKSGGGWEIPCQPWRNSSINFVIGIVTSRDPRIQNKAKYGGIPGFHRERRRSGGSMTRLEWNKLACVGGGGREY